MTTCGFDFEDETKDDDSIEDLRLAFVCDFPIVTKREMRTITRENLLVKDDDGKLVDRRVEVLFNDLEFHSASYFILCQVTANLKGEKHLATGSGCMWGWPEDHIYLTCAHNLRRFSALTGKLVEQRDLRVYVARQLKACLAYGKVNYKSILTHPKYIGHPECGFDIGIFKAVKVKKGKYTSETHGSIKTVINDVMIH